MNKYFSAQVFSSSAGLVSLAAMVTAAIWWLSNGRATPGELLVANCSVAAFACLVWSGMLGQKGAYLATDSALAWLSVGAIGGVLSAFFVWLDCDYAWPTFRPAFTCAGTPGLTSIITVLALLLTVIAIPTALRAALLQRFGRPPI